MRIFTKENLKKLTNSERHELMWRQMQPRWGHRSGYLPDDCSECGCCGQPMFGSGWCGYCYDRYDELIKKAIA